MPRTEFHAVPQDSTAAAAEPTKPRTNVAAVPALREPAQSQVSTAGKSRYWLWAWAGLAAVGLAGLLYFQPWASTATPVAIEVAILAPATRVLAVNGRIAAVNAVDMRAPVGGTLSKVVVKEGDVVAAGAELVQIDPAAQQAVVRQATAGLDAALLAEEYAKATLARTEALGANAPRTSLADALRARQTAAQEVARTTAVLDQAVLRLKDYTILAPMAGTVLAMTLNAGQIVDTSTPLMTIADMSHLVVETDVDEAYATQVHKGQTAVMQLSGETEVRAAKVDFVSQQVNAASGGLAVTLAFDAPVTAPIGLTVTANVVVDSRLAAITVPRTAVLTTAEGSAVFVVVGATAQRRDVAVIDWPAARLIVTTGLAAGDIVIADAAGLTDGQSVTAVQP